MVYARRRKTWVNYIKWGKIERVENKRLKVKKFNFMNSNLQKKKFFHLKKRCKNKDCKQRFSKRSPSTICIENAKISTLKKFYLCFVFR